ncbi:hypothetical protein [Streptomyces spectabilis]|uniref:Uncharacterized protein n=1 Tax=Streptomyces spectabilis TaxID=68270 RepID=A0A5P2X266_STRST|nr:hypothetical protein [Streptomyces spectabilis]MBB5108248.1 hypothetical protein [Streptomyces spectabilis]MCI3901010.1 hypothetical protein [Streptomyces spectabilis]QEV58511.1 hypothetical protein CP982_07155 [Streptomyces spectabilis]GGV45456.1 hypothetical protein GCM10010245_71100 [Streptomyces spectabilis]
MNFLMQQTLTNGSELPDGPHFTHCYIYAGAHCSCGGNYQGDRPGPELDPSAVVALAEQAER